MGMLQYLSSIAILITTRGTRTHTTGLYKDASHGSLILGILHSRLPTIPPTRTLRAIAAVGTAFNVFSFDAVWVEHRTHHLPNAEQIRYVLCQGRGLNTDLRNKKAYSTHCCYDYNPPMRYVEQGIENYAKSKPVI